jgi:hypothetical protein
MSLIAAQTKVQADSAFPRDGIVMTSHFNTQLDLLNPVGGTDWQSLATDINTAFKTVLGNFAGYEFSTKLYDLDDAKPRPVQAQATLNTGAAGTAGTPREVALCLSFYAERNLPRQRGRIYVPSFLAGGAIGVRPSATQQTRLLDLADALSGIGGSNVDWCVFSRTDNVHRKVTQAYVDDEWDTVRSRGLRPTSRASRAQSG